VNPADAVFLKVDLNATLLRALRWLGVFVLVLIPVVWWLSNWQSVVLLLVGALVSATGIWEWKSLFASMNARLDKQQDAKPMGPVLVLFFLRMGFAAALLYVSLRCLAGSVYALLAGLCLSLVALGIEAFRMLRN